jgi:hypothetical protein
MFRNGVDPLTHRPVRDRAPNGRPWPRGFRNGNPGNLDFNPENRWQGQLGLEVLPPGVRGRARFAVFQSAVWGIRAILRLLISYQDKHDIRTVRGVIKRWAPSVENDTDSYVYAATLATGFGEHERLDLHTYEHAVPLARAIVRHELGNPRDVGLSDWYSDEVWEDAATRAGLVRRNPKPVAKDADVLAGGAAVAAAGVSAADGLGLVRQFVQPGSTAAQVIGVLAAVLVVYLLLRALKRRKREAS